MYDNVRKFIVYIFAHATPEVVPFLVFAFGGGLIPLAAHRAADPGLRRGVRDASVAGAGRDPAEPGIMDHPPRPPDEGVIRPPMLLRAWLFLGVLVAALEMAASSSCSTRRAGIRERRRARASSTPRLSPGDHDVVRGHDGRPDRDRVRGAHPAVSRCGRSGSSATATCCAAIGGVILFAAAFVYIPPLQTLLGTAALPPRDVLFLLPYPFIVCGADELRRLLMRRWSAGRGHPAARHGPAAAT